MYIYMYIYIYIYIFHVCVYIYIHIYTYIYTCIMLFHALKCNFAYIDVYSVIAVMPGVGMYVNTRIYHVLS